MATSNEREVTQLAQLLRPIAAVTVSRLCEEVLTTSQQRIAYESCDGMKPGKEIASLASVSPASVSGWSRRWRELGMVVENDDGHLEHLFSLAALGLPLDPSPDASA